MKYQKCKCCGVAAFPESENRKYCKNCADFLLKVQNKFHQRIWQIKRQHERDIRRLIIQKEEKEYELETINIKNKRLGN